MLGSLLSLLLLVGPAPAGPTPMQWPEHREVLEVLPEDKLDMDEARRLFAAGKQAAERGRWDEAIRYFAEAYRHSGSPGQLYSLGRGHRELYFHHGRDPVQLRLALLRFGQYLEQSPQGRNRDNARQYIEELRPYVTVLEGFDQPVVITRLMVHSPVDTAEVSLDDGAPQPAPITLDVAPGRHRVRVSAEGYHQVVRTVEVPEGATVPLEVALRERAAEVQLAGPAGAELYVDGQRSGRLPLDEPLKLPAGDHQIAVAQPGREPYVRALSLSRGSTQNLRVQLATTAQRKGAYVALGVGGAGVLASGTLMGLALARQREAADIEQARRTEGVSQERFEQGQQAWRQRDAFRAAAISTGVVGVLSIGTGLALYFTDNQRLDDRLERPERTLGRWRLVPAVSPGSAAAAVVGRF